MYQNNIYFLFFKIYFWYQYMKTFQKHIKKIDVNKKIQKIIK